MEETSMRKFRAHIFWLMTALATTSLVAVAVPNQFRPGDVISSTLVNANFSDLEERVRVLEASARSIPTVRTSNAATIAPLDFTGAVARCTGNEVLTGGGCSYLNYAGGPGDQNIAASGPIATFFGLFSQFPSSYAVNSSTGGNSWLCVVEETQGVEGNTFQAFAVCSTR
jgi:hypothetical protein